MISDQLYLFLIFVLTGSIIGLVFDVFRILRITFKTADIVTYIEDFLFWIISGLILIYSISVFNNGEIRLYVFLGVIIGISLYILILSKYIIKINVKIINFLKFIICKVLNIFIIPIKMVINFIKRLLLKPFIFMIINFRKLSTNFLNVFKKKHIISKNENKGQKTQKI